MKQIRSKKSADLGLRLLSRKMTYLRRTVLVGLFVCPASSDTHQPHTQTTVNNTHLRVA